MMATQLKPIESDAEFRSRHVGAAEVATLFDASPYQTRFQLWHQKRGSIAVDDLSDNERVLWGSALEPVIVAEACRRYGYQPEATPAHLDNGNGLGGHPDRFVICPERGPGILETKTVDWLVCKKWGDEPPLNYLLQTQSYIGLSRRTWGEVVVLVGGNELRRFPYDFRPAIYAEIESRVAEFWRTVRDNVEPPVDYARDHDALIEAIGLPDGSLVDLRQSDDAAEIAAEFLAAKQAGKEAEVRAEIAKCKLIEKIGAAETALLDGFRISANQTKGSAGTLIKPEMVGTCVGVRKGYRRFDVKEVA